MLRITVELLPGGCEDGQKILATGDIARVTGRRLGTYSIVLHEEPFGMIARGELVNYPRYGKSIWDLVARCAIVAMTGREEMPPRPTLPDVPIHHTGSLPYVRLSEIPQPARALFERNLQTLTRSLIAGVDEPGECVRASVWVDFLDGKR
ncbi:hypothetical protein D2917_07840 [Cupriavidus oxalaticus]|uniref:Uncharacterized protein n=1 Tax=Cupriavidus oxalaticus TaxID=96344 RepID=A0A5P3VH36_9BURK|nr:hypothetical protein D2917_07840 [Cupriavidus oxalaticus]